jgi:hypothetical protein
MRFSQRILIAAAATMAMVIPAGAAMAHGYIGTPMNMSVPESFSYSGNWPVTISGTQHGTFTGCLTLTQHGINSGSASLVSGGTNYTFGTFQVINHILVATIQSPGGTGQNAGLVFIGPASRGNIGRGVFDEVYGGEAFVEGALAFGLKGGC